MMNRLLLVLLLCLGTLAGRNLAAQDPTFSQLFASPTTLNPALTGLFAGRYRAVISHRSQWAEVMPSPFSTTAFAADFRYSFDPKRRNSDAFGGGLLFMNDRVASVNLATNQILFGGAYHKNLDGRGIEQLSAGFQVGIAQRSLSYGELSFEDEFDGTSSYIGGSGGEVLPENSVSYGDYQFGINYSRNPLRALGVTAGLAIHHVSQPEQSFYTAEDTGDTLQISNKLFARYSGYLNLRLPLSSSTELLPRMYVLSQGPHQMAVVGSHIRFAASSSDRTAFHLGALLRVAGDRQGYRASSAIGFVGLDVGDFLFGFSYDAGVFQGGNAGDRNRGTFELSASYIGMSEDDAAVPCPKF